MAQPSQRERQCGARRCNIYCIGVGDDLDIVWAVIT